MKAALLAAGLGTRLAPLTKVCPKVLIPVANVPLLKVLLQQLADAGCDAVAINTHHLGPAVKDFLETQGPWGMPLHILHEPEILGTGGGLRELGKTLGTDRFLAINGDILTDINLAEIFRRHQPGALATLILHDYPPLNNVWLDSRGRVTAVGDGRPTGSAAVALAYTGIQVVSREFLTWLPPTGVADLVTVWRHIIAAGGWLAGLVVSGHFWQDLGTPAAYLAAHHRLLSAPPQRLKPYFPNLTDPLVGPGAVLEPDVTCAGNVSLGASSRIGAGVWLKNTVIWSEAWVAPGVHLDNCIVARGVKVLKSAQNQLICENL